ncbi:MAG TPA: hypothetical protein PLH94_08170 [Fimbriimonadaceae bacterium]|nr:hypothetical protein [Fimbriimonadaceae bacterium]
MLTLLAALVGIVSFVCWLVIVIDAFKDSILKGLLCLLCGLYYLWYAFFDFEHDNKWLIVLVSIFGGGLASWLYTIR